MSTDALKGHTTCSCVSPTGLQVPDGHRGTSVSLSRGHAPEGRSLRTTLRPMVPCAPALQLARLLGSFFKLRRRVVARFPELRARARLVIWWLWLVRYRRLGRSDPGGEWRCRAGCVGFSGHTSPRQARWAPLAAPVTEPLRAHSAGFCSQALFFGRDRHGVPAEFLGEEEGGEGEEHPGGGEMQVGPKPSRIWSASFAAVRAPARCQERNCLQCLRGPNTLVS